MNRDLGTKGEELASAAARAEGYSVLASNYRCPLGEIDLVLQQGSTIVFAEVKTRRGNSYGEPWEAVTEAKQERIRRVAIWYVQQHNLQLTYRFDVFTVFATRGTWQYRWYKDAF
jgi:putative endonuclease